MQICVHKIGGGTARKKLTATGKRIGAEKAKWLSYLAVPAVLTLLASMLYATGKIIEAPYPKTSSYLTAAGCNLAIGQLAIKPLFELVDYINYLAKQQADTEE